MFIAKTFRTFTLLLVFLSPAIVAQSNSNNDLFSLSLKQLLEIEITSVSKIEEQLEDAAATVYIFERQQFEALGINNLIDLLRYAPSVEYAYPHSWLQGGMRGFADNWSKVKLLLDGEEINLMYTGEAFIGHQYSLHNIERVEIIPGPASVIYGADAYTGIINLVSRQDKASEFRAHHSIAKRGFTSTGLSLYHGGRSPKSEWDFSAYYQNMDDADFSNFVGTQDFSEVNQSLRAEILQSPEYPYRDENYAYSLQGNWQKTINLEHAFRLSAHKLYDRDGGGQESPEISFTEFYTKRNQDKLSLSHVYTARNGKLNSTLNFRYRKDDELNKFNYRSPYEGGVSPLYNFNIKGSEEYALRWDSNYNLLDYDLTLSGGLGLVLKNLKVPDFEEGDFEFLKPYLDQENVHLYLQLTKGFFNQKGKLSLGVRKDDNKNYDSPSVHRLAYIARLTESWTIKFLYGESFRVPTLFELEIVDTLKPSLIKTQEFSSTYTLSQNWLLQRSLYRNTARDFIAIIQTANAEDDLFGGFNVEESEAEGAEIKISYFGERGHIMAWWNHTNTVSQENIAKNKWALSSHYTINRWLSAGVTFKRTDAIYTYYQSQVIPEYMGDNLAEDTAIELNRLNLPSYTATDLNLNITPTQHNFFAYIKLWNVFNKINRYPNVRGNDPKQFLELGRKVEVGLRYSF